MSLDDIKTYTTYDKEEISFGIEHLPEQVGQAGEKTRTIKIPSSFKASSNVVVMGMGGSALGPHMIQSVFQSQLSVPFEFVNHYQLPGSVSKKSLVVLSSFSGNTEEIVAAAKEAKKKGANIVVSTVGGKLKAFAASNKVPLYTFAPGDLAKQPRLGIGFTMIGILGMLERMELVKVSEKDIKKMVSAMVEVVDTCSLDVSSKENPAKIVAKECESRPLLIVAAEHLSGNAHAFQNQVNETSKQVAFYDILPELNHHRLEGLSEPSGLFKRFTVLMLRSELYHARVQRRFDLTAEVFEQLGGRVIDYNCGGGSRLEEAGEVLQFSSFVSYYLGMVNKVEPEKIPYVDWFKKQLSKKK